MWAAGIWTIGLGVLLGMAALTATWVAFVHPWHVRWGATDGEVDRGMPGDDLMAAPCHVTTRAITVRARPDEIWPWLAQMGKGRGGLYSVDWLDEPAPRDPPARGGARRRAAPRRGARDESVVTVRPTASPGRPRATRPAA